MVNRITLSLRSFSIHGSMGNNAELGMGVPVGLRMRPTRSQASTLPIVVEISQEVEVNGANTDSYELGERYVSI